MNKDTLFITIIFIFLYLSSCNSPEKSNRDLENNSSLKEENAETSGEKGRVVQLPADSIDQAEHIEQKYGRQWDFCNCIKKNDSINRIDVGKLDEQQLEKVMLRWEQIERKCKNMLITPNTTPEQRKQHDLKVKECLNEN